MTIAFSVFILSTFNVIATFIGFKCSRVILLTIIDLGPSKRYMLNEVFSQVRLLKPLLHNLVNINTVSVI